VTLISSKKITNWEIGSISFFVILAMSSFLPKVGLLVPEWSLYWLVVWLQYTCIVTIWIKVTITIKLYKSMRLLKGIQSYQLKKSYKRLIYQNIAMWFWEPVLGYLWAHGWVFEQDFVKRMCFLKIGEASATYHTLMIVLFLNVITKFRFGDKQKQVVHSPVMVAMTVTDHPTPDTKVAE
jgi:hypothetical protein